jgi:hypothetical protein
MSGWGRTKPPLGTPIQRGLLGLRAALMPSHGGGDVFDQDNLRLTLGGGAVWGIGPNGYRIVCSGNNARAAATASDVWKPALPFTYIFAGEVLATPANGGESYFGVAHNNSVSPPYVSWSVDIASSALRAYFNDGSSITNINTGALPSVGKFWAAVVMANGDQRLYYNSTGSPAATGTVAITSLAYGATAQLHIGEAWNNQNRNPGFALDYAYLFNGVLPTAAMSRIYDDPYSLFAPPGPSLFWFGDVGGAASATGALTIALGATTLSGSATFTAATPSAGTLTKTLGAITLASTATFAAAGASAGTLSTTLGATTLSGAATFTAAAASAGTLATTLGAITLTGAATFTAAGSAGASLAATLGAITLTGAASFTAAGSTTFAADDFNGGTAGTNLGTVAASDGGTWTSHSSFTLGDIDYETVSSVKGIRGKAASLDLGLFYHSGTPASADYTVSANLYEIGTAGSFKEIGVAGRIDTAADTVVTFGYQQTTGWVLRQRSSGSASILSSSAATLTDGQAYRIDLVFSGNQATGKVDGTTVCGPSTTSLTSAGKAGVWAIGSGTANNYHYLDDFNGSTVATTTGTLSSALGAITVSGVSELTPATPSAGTLNAVLGACGISSTGTAGTPANAAASLTVTLGAVVLVGRGTIPGAGGTGPTWFTVAIAASDAQWTGTRLESDGQWTGAKLDGFPNV